MRPNQNKFNSQFSGIFWKSFKVHKVFPEKQPTSLAGFSIKSQFASLQNLGVFFPIFLSSFYTISTIFQFILFCFMLLSVFQCQRLLLWRLFFGWSLRVQEVQEILSVFRIRLIVIGTNDMSMFFVLYIARSYGEEKA